jgi:hypothetical protein
LANPSTLLAKLSAFPRQNGLALALRDLSRINQNTLARALFFNRLGELRDRTFESQFYRASGLNLLINAIVYWNTLHLEPAFAELNWEGIVTPPDVIKHITPLGWQHISLTGDYIWTSPTSGHCGEKPPFSQHDHRMFSNVGQIHHFRDGVDTPLAAEL